jgi:hypothetical protein
MTAELKQEVIATAYALGMLYAEYENAKTAFIDAEQDLNAHPTSFASAKKQDAEIKFNEAKFAYGQASAAHKLAIEKVRHAEEEAEADRHALRFG